MNIARYLVPVLFAAALTPRAAFALPWSYAHEHPAECADAWAKKTTWRSTCGSRAFCDAHRNDDRISRIVCDPYVSMANRKLPFVTINRAWLNAARDLTEQETFNPCGPIFAPVVNGKTEYKTDPGTTLPAQMKTARLALCAAIDIGMFPTTIVKVGIGPGGTGVMEVFWNRDDASPRQNRSVRLNAAEVTQLLVALNRSDFWRLPTLGGHNGVADGEVARVEVIVAGRRNIVLDAIGGADTVDVSILVNALSEIIAKHWKNVPGA